VNKEHVNPSEPGKKTEIVIHHWSTSKERLNGRRLGRRRTIRETSKEGGQKVGGRVPPQGKVQHLTQPRGRGERSLVKRFKKGRRNTELGSKKYDYEKEDTELGKGNVRARGADGRRNRSEWSLH